MLTDARGATSTYTLTVVIEPATIKDSGGNVFDESLLDVLENGKFDFYIEYAEVYGYMKIVFSQPVLVPKELSALNETMDIFLRNADGWRYYWNLIIATQTYLLVSFQVASPNILNLDISNQKVVVRFTEPYFIRGDNGAFITDNPRQQDLSPVLP